MTSASFAQIIERKRPTEWKNLVKGGQFIDLFLPMTGKVLTTDTWGAACVKPRYIDNGLEDHVLSYWGGNIVKDEKGVYHLYVCAWAENAELGHWAWPYSSVYHATATNSVGPYTVQDSIGTGHNPEIFRSKDGSYVIYAIVGKNVKNFVSDNLNGPWTEGSFEFDPRDRKIIEGKSNMTFASREDGSVLMVCRGGGVWISKDGLSTYNQISDKRVYPDVEGRFEDPVIWKDKIQYHLVVNDWYGRIAFYLRSKDGVKWVVDAGEAYAPGIAVHANGHKEDWFKYERMKVLQDEHGRVSQVNFAVIDTLKHQDFALDTHSSKNISIPFNKGVLIELQNKKMITAKTKEIAVKILAEEGFNPQTDIDINSLRFGAPTEVNFGRGSTVLRTENVGNDLLVTFAGEGNGITPDEFAPKLLGTYKNGMPLYAYTRVPWIDYVEPILSARAVKMNENTASVVVENFGQVAASKVLVNFVAQTQSGEQVNIGKRKIRNIAAYGSQTLSVDFPKKINAKEIKSISTEIIF